MPRAYPVALLIALAAAPAAGTSGIGYDTVAAAKNALVNTAGATVRERAGWVHVLLDEGRQRWTFVPRTHRAWPAAVRRDVVMRDDKPALETRMLCEAARPACDALFERLRTADENLSRELGITPAADRQR